jgi:hypothetical protein
MNEHVKAIKALDSALRALDKASMVEGVSDETFTQIQAVTLSLAKVKDGHTIELLRAACKEYGFKCPDSQTKMLRFFDLVRGIV